MNRLLSQSGVAAQIVVWLGSASAFAQCPVSFAPAGGYNVFQQFPVAVAVSDANRDGRPDLLVVSGYGGLQGHVLVFLANPDGTFQPPITNWMQGQPLSFAVADF